jgi:hypothetical protein
MTKDEYARSLLAIADRSGMLNPYALAPPTWLRDRSALPWVGLPSGITRNKESA